MNSLYVLTLLLAPTAANGDELRERLFHDGANSWRSMESTLESLAGTVRRVHEVNWPGQSPEVTTDISEFCFSKHGMLYREESEGSEGNTESISAINDTYEFLIYQGQSKHSWTIGQITARHEQRQIADRLKAWQRSAKPLIPISVYNSPLFDALRPDTVTDVVLGDAFLDVTFEIPDGLLISKGDGPSENEYLLGGIVSLDPDTWCVTKYEVRVRFGTDGVATINGEVEYHGDLDGTPLPKRYVESLDAMEEAGVRWKSVFEFSDLHRCDLGAKDFTLTAYGLPEPEFGVDHQYVRTIFIVCGALTVLVVLGIWMRRRSYA